MPWNEIRSAASFEIYLVHRDFERGIYCWYLRAAIFIASWQLTSLTSASLPGKRVLQVRFAWFWLGFISAEFARGWRTVWIKIALESATVVVVVVEIKRGWDTRAHLRASNQFFEHIRNEACEPSSIRRGSCTPSETRVWRYFAANANPIARFVNERFRSSLKTHLIGIRSIIKPDTRWYYYALERLEIVSGFIKIWISNNICEFGCTWTFDPQLRTPNFKLLAVMYILTLSY